MKTTHTHTSGPWRVENWKYPNSKEVARRDGIVTIVTESDAIAQLCNLWRPDDDPAETISKNEVMANARLIAAAPELLEVAKWVAECLPEIIRTHCPLGVPLSVSSVHDMALDAVKKAEGRDA